MTALAARLLLSLRRPWLPLEGEDWTITGRDLAEGLALLLMFGGAFAVWRALSV